MSIQGSVNQLFTIGGSFAGMYGLLHPEIAQSRQLLKETNSKLGYVQEYLSKDDIPNLNEMSKEQLNELEDKVNMTSETAEKLFSDVHKNPSLLKNKEIKETYDTIVKSKDKFEFNDVRKGIANRRDVLNQPTLDEVIQDMRDKGFNVSIGYPTDKAQTKLQADGMQKVNQRDAYAKRRKDKGDI
ncbi:MAG: hypothetical protein ACI4OP_03335 [Candidatus Coprovivens sp.]